MSELSEEDLRLVNALQLAPLVSWRQLSRVLPLSASGLAQRWQRLTDRGQAWVTAYPLGAGRGECLGFVFVSCSQSARQGVIDELIATAEVVSLDVLDRQQELLLTVRAVDYATLTSRTLPVINAIDGVLGIEVTLCTSLHSSGVDWQVGALSSGEARRLRNIDRTRTKKSSDAQLQVPDPAARVLARNARASAADLARVMDVHPSTGQRWLTRILDRGALTFRCDISHLAAGFPLIISWRARLPAELHGQVGPRIAAMPQVRLCASTTGSFNLLVTMWLASPQDILSAEQQLNGASPSLEILSSSVSTLPVKRVGHLLDASGATIGRSPE